MRRFSFAIPMALVCVLVAASGCGGGAAPAGPAPNASEVTPTTDATGVGGTAVPTTTSTNSGGGDSGGSANSGQNSDWPASADCVSYNPNNLSKRYAAGVWTVNDGALEVLRVHGGPDDNVGDKGLALARRYTSHCFIGRGNHRQEKYSYIFDYWRGSSGISTTIPDQEEDCSRYNRNNISIDEMGDDAWRVKDHDHVLHAFDTQNDARDGKLVLGRYNQICFIGNDPLDDSQGQELVNYML